MADEIEESQAEELARMLGEVVTGTLLCISSVVMELSAAGVADHKLVGRKLKATAADIKRRSRDKLTTEVKMLERLGQMIETPPPVVVGFKSGLASSNRRKPKKEPNL